MIGWPLPADSRILAGLAARDDRHRQHRLYRVVALVESRRDRAAGIPVDAERQLGHIIRANREAVEILEETIRQDGVRRNLAHHDDAQAVPTALEPMCLE